MKTFWVVALVVIGICCWLIGFRTTQAQASPAAQIQAPAQASARVPAGADQQAAVATNPALSTGTETGIATFQQRCMVCHGNPNVPQAPSPAAIRQMPPERIYDALTTGVMKPQGDALTDSQRRMLATFLAGRPLGSMKEGDAKQMPNQCDSNPPLADPASEPAWNGWGADVENTRFQLAKDAGITPEQVPQLKLKWAFGYPTGLSAFNQPTVVSGRVFVGTDIGYVYSINAKTGCVYWSYQTQGSVRASITIAPVTGNDDTKYAAFFGDAHANAYAIDAQDGHQLWMTKVDDNFITRVTAAPKVYEDRVYVPVSSSEEFSASSLDYSCCTARGAIVALDANTGKIIWKTYTVPTPKPTRKNSKGVQQYAPSGGSVWNSPTIDPKLGAIYFGTGDGQNVPVPDTTDAIMALDMKTGNVLWSYQVVANDAFMGGCNGPARTDNCPPENGPDQDIGNSPILRTLASGKRVLVFGTKDGHAIALDPDRKGALLWNTTVFKVPAGQENSFAAKLNGIVWGGSADDKNVYYGLQSGGIVALDMATGSKVWYTQLAKPGSRVSNSAASSTIPGVSFVAGSDGKLHAVATDDGHVVWEYNTARDFDTVNKVPAHGGAINSIGPSIVDGMLYIASGYAVTGTSSGNVLLCFSPE
jgi:polyvinyl alcohol dehydrogenase (cytochrome)